MKRLARNITITPGAMLKRKCSRAKRNRRKALHKIRKRCKSLKTGKRSCWTSYRSKSKSTKSTTRRVCKKERRSIRRHKKALFKRHRRLRRQARSLRKALKAAKKGSIVHKSLKTHLHLVLDALARTRGHLHAHSIVRLNSVRARLFALRRRIRKLTALKRVFGGKKANSAKTARFNARINKLIKRLHAKMARAEKSRARHEKRIISLMKKGKCLHKDDNGKCLQFKRPHMAVFARYQRNIHRRQRHIARMAKLLKRLQLKKKTARRQRQIARYRRRLAHKRARLARRKAFLAKISALRMQLSVQRQATAKARAAAKATKGASSKGQGKKKPNLKSLVASWKQRYAALKKK